jgi:hypothetical protein
MQGNGRRAIEGIRKFIVYVVGTEKNLEKHQDIRRLRRDSNRHFQNANLMR